MINELLRKQIKELAAKRDDVIRHAITKAGHDANDMEFLKHNLKCVEYISDNNFQHFYIESIRIISIKKIPDVSSIEFVDNSYKQTMSYQYY